MSASEEDAATKTVETSGLKETAAVLKKLFEGSWGANITGGRANEGGRRGKAQPPPADASPEQLTERELRIRQHRALEDSILVQSSQALEEIEAEYKAGEAALLFGDPEKHVERFMTALERLTQTLERIPRPVPPFTKDSVLYKVLADGWLDILMSTLQAPVTDPLYRRSIETITTILLVGNIRGRYTELPGFAKLIIICVSGLSQVAVIFRSFEAAASATGTDIPPKAVDELPMQIESCIRLLGVVSWILEDHASEAVRERWRSHLVQCGLVTFAINILTACQSVLLLDRASRCLASAFEIHPAHEVVLQSRHFLHDLTDKVVSLYRKKPSQQDCGGVPYVLMRLLYNRELLVAFIEYDDSKGNRCALVILDALRTCASTNLALTSFCRILGLLARDEEAACNLLENGALDVLADAAVNFTARNIAPAEFAIKVLHELIREGTIDASNKDVISKHFLSALSTAVAANLVLLEFMTSLHRGLLDTQMGRIEVKDVIEANLADDSLFWLLVSLSRSAAVITRIAELFPTKDVPMAVYIVATFCATSQGKKVDSVQDSLDAAWAVKRREWHTENPTGMLNVAAGVLLGRCDQCAKLPEQQGLLKICSRCRKTRYCSQVCQRASWKQHKRECIAAEEPTSGSKTAATPG
eukprot:m.263115 g.263115  ORF g.263115 m.263115 type:complete len:646 (+) comp16007_c0_seq24:233-2170(+)